MPKEAILPTAQTLTRLEKAAVLCVALGEDFTSEVYKTLRNEDEIQELAQEMSRFTNIGPELFEPVLEEFSELLLGSKFMAAGGLDHARNALVKAFGAERAEEILRRVQRELDDTGLSRLRKADPDELVTRLRNQYPQAVAVILAHLKPIQSAQVLAQLENELASEIIFRIATLDKVPPEVLSIIEDALGVETDLSFGGQATAAGGPEAVAEVLNLMGGAGGQGILELLSKRDSALGEEIRSKMFTFEDILKLDERSIRKVMGAIDSTKDLALAFKTATEGLKKKLRENMTERARRGLEDEIEMLGPVRLKDVEEAQTRIVGVVRTLEEEGAIVLGGGAGEDAIVQ